MFDLFYHPIYTDGIDKRSRFPRERYQLTKEALYESKHAIRFVQPKMANIEDIYVAHGRKYVDSFIAGRLSNKEKREIGLQPWNNQIVDRTRYIMGGSLGALKSAINSDGIAGNMAGGTHHAYHSKGSGYCIFNDCVFMNFCKIIISLLRSSLLLQLLPLFLRRNTCLENQ